MDARLRLKLRTTVTTIPDAIDGLGTKTSPAIVSGHFSFTRELLREYYIVAGRGLHTPVILNYT